MAIYREEEVKTIPFEEESGEDDLPIFSLLICYRDDIKLEPLIPGQKIVIGRAHPAQLIISEQSLSRQHASFELLDGQVWVEDLGSMNGTLLNEERISRSPMKRGDVARMGAVTASLQAFAPTDPACLAAATAGPVLAAQGRLSSRGDGARRAKPAAGAPVILSGAMRSIFTTVQRLAQTAIPVLICGETGSGKEVIARAIHEGGPRRARKMLCINCGAIPRHLIESALFGHERGAFTGADQVVKGAFEEAGAGTILLDEIGELSPAAQAALLRVLDTRTVSRVGSHREIEVQARVLAATNRDLEEMCAAGTFRPDLYYRLNSITIAVPPLRERIEEIEPLALQFVEQASTANSRPPPGIAANIWGVLQRYPWPGNVRELRNAIDRAVVVCQGEVLTLNDLPERIRCWEGGALARLTSHPPAIPNARPTTAPIPPGHTDLPSVGSAPQIHFKSRVQLCEAALILDALDRTDWNQTEAAHQLRIPVRTLFYKIRAHGITRGSSSIPALAALPDFERHLLLEEGGASDFKRRIQRYETALIRDALQRTNGNLAHAARFLNIPPSTLSYKMRAYDIAGPAEE